MKNTIHRRSPVVVVASLALALSSTAAAQPAAKGEAENLVPPGGAAFDIPIHAGEVCILSFPSEKLVDSTALVSSADFEVQRWAQTESPYERPARGSHPRWRSRPRRGRSRST